MPRIGTPHYAQASRLKGLLNGLALLSENLVTLFTTLVG